MNVLGQDGVRPSYTDNHVSCTPKPVLCFGVRISSRVVWWKFENRGEGFFLPCSIVWDLILDRGTPVVITYQSPQPVSLCYTDM